MVVAVAVAVAAAVAEDAKLSFTKQVDDVVSGWGGDLPPYYPQGIPLGAYRVNQLGHEVFFARQDIIADDRSPYGVFPTSVAVDRSAVDALQRARFEAAERFALSAINNGRKFFNLRDIDAKSIFSYPYKLESPLNGSGRNLETLAIEIVENINCTFSHAVVADIFAPYPINKFESSWHPTTNGVAVAKTIEDAKLASYHEYLERHCIMNFWYRGTPSYLIDSYAIDNAALQENFFLDQLGYSTVSIEISEMQTTTVVLTFAVNRAGQFPYLVCSAATSPEIDIAVRKSFQEVIQTLIACASQHEEFSIWKNRGGRVESLNHRMYYFADPDRSNSHSQILKEIVAKSIRTKDRPFTINNLWRQEITSSGHACSFVDLTPDDWNGLLSCVRCISSTMTPLVVSESMMPLELVQIGSNRFAAPHPFP